MTKYKKIPLEVSIHVRYLYQQQKMTGKELKRMYPSYPMSTLYRHAKKPIKCIQVDKRHQNKARPKKLCERDQRTLLREVQN